MVVAVAAAMVAAVAVITTAAAKSTGLRQINRGKLSVVYKAML